MQNATHQGGASSCALDPLSDKVPQNHVNHKDDECKDGGEESHDRHHDGGEARGGGDTQDTKDEGEKGNKASDWVNDQNVSEVVKTGWVDVGITAH